MTIKIISLFTHEINQFQWGVWSPEANTIPRDCVLANKHSVFIRLKKTLKYATQIALKHWAFSAIACLSSIVDNCLIYSAEKTCLSSIWGFGLEFQAVLYVKSYTSPTLYGASTGSFAPFAVWSLINSPVAKLKPPQQTPSFIFVLDTITTLAISNTFIGL